MRSLALAALTLIAGVATAAGQSAPPAADSGGSGTSPAPVQATTIGFAFVDSSVTGQGSLAQLPPNAKVYPSGSSVTGTEGCPTTQYRTDGLLVAVIDYGGRPTAASLAVTRHMADGNTFDNAPYYLDLNPGRTLQFLGPIFDNGIFDLKLEYDYAQGQGKSATATIELARSCPSS